MAKGGNGAGADETVWQQSKPVHPATPVLVQTLSGADVVAQGLHIPK